MNVNIDQVLAQDGIVERLVSTTAGTCREDLIDDLVDLFEGRRESKRVLEEIGRSDWEREERIDEKAPESERLTFPVGDETGEDVNECEYRPSAGSGRWVCCIDGEYSTPARKESGCLA